MKKSTTSEDSRNSNSKFEMEKRITEKLKKYFESEN